MPESTVPRKITRRQLIGGAVAAGLGAYGLANWKPRPARAAGNSHLVWVWQFSTDAEPTDIAMRLRRHGLGIIMKTHDGVDWMSEFDTSRYAVSGHRQVETLANFFEGEGVPFHAWSVLHGNRPIEEARLAAAVLLSGARSLFLDVEPHAGFWRGTAEDARVFGQELRRLAPNGEVVLSIDARPWLKEAIPLREFVPFINAIAPQHYWHTFNTPANYDKFRQAGFPVPEGGITPEFLLGTTYAAYRDIPLPVHHTGQGSTSDPGEWDRFINDAYALDSDFVSVWRYGVTDDSVLEVLQNRPPRQTTGTTTVPTALHIVEPGETLGLIAVIHGTTVQTIVDANQLSDPNYVFIGQELIIPGSKLANSTAVLSSPPPAAAAPSVAPVTSGTTYTVSSGDTLSSIAGRFGSSVDAIVSANSLGDPNYIYVGQQLTIP